MRAHLLTVAALAVVAGCGSGPKVVSVSGKATHKGEPIPGLEINFYPETGRPSNGHTDKQGQFVLDYDPQQKGALVGKHTVTASYKPMTPEEEMGQVKPHPAVKFIGDKYGDQMKSPMKVEITKADDGLELKFD